MACSGDALEKSTSKRRRKTMKKICSAYGCNNYADVNEERLSFFKFPPDRDVCKAWVRKLRRADLEGLEPQALRHRIVCEKHFDSSQFTRGSKAVKR